MTNSTPSQLNDGKQQKISLKLPFWRQLRWTLMGAFVLLAFLSVGITIVAVNAQARSQTNKLIEQVNTVADSREDSIAYWLDTNTNVFDRFLREPGRKDRIVLFATAVSEEGPANNESEQEAMNRLLREVVVFEPDFDHIFVYGVDGKIIAASNWALVGRNIGGQPYYDDSLNDGYVQPPYYDLEQGQLVMYVTRPIVNENSGELAGVLAGRLNLEELDRVMEQELGFGNIETYLVSETNNYLTAPNDFSSAAYTLPSRTSDGIQNGLSRQAGTSTYQNYQDPPQTVLGAYRWVPELNSTLMIEMDYESAFAPITLARNFTITVSVITALFTILIASFLSLYITKPITALTKVAVIVAEGDINQRADISQKNEIGLLAESFNLMTDQLQQVVGSLEDQVANRTRRLEIVAAMGERFSTLLNLDDLLGEVVIRIREDLGYYHAHIYLLDTATRQLVVKAGTGTAGMKMKADGHSIALDNPNSIVARAARSGQIVRVDDVRQSEHWLPNPLLPDTRSEMALPIVLSDTGTVVGVIDVQEDRIAGLDETDSALLRTLATQAAGALRTSRQISEVQETLAEAQAIQAQFIEKSWDTVKAVERKGQYHYAQVQNPLSEAAIEKARREAEVQDRPAIIHIDEFAPDATALVAPLTFRNTRIGSLQLHTPAEGQSWTEDDMAIVEAIVDQITQSAESLRLFEDVNERAAREQTIRAVTDKLRQSKSMDALLHTAVRELGMQLGATRTVVDMGIDLGSAEAEESEAGNGHAQR